MGTLLKDGVVAMVLGMGMVYVFLIIMIILMNLMSKLLAPYAGFLEKPVPQPKAKRKNTPAPGSLSAEDRVLALAAIEAVKQYRGAK